MGRARDLDEIKHTEDILNRASRPQRQSSHIPTRRDWRYETGVYQHDDNTQGPGSQTIWDMLDEDYQQGTFGRERRRWIGKTVVRDGHRVPLLALNTNDTDADEGTNYIDSPAKTSLMGTPGTPRTSGMARTPRTPSTFFLTPKKFPISPAVIKKKAPPSEDAPSRALSTHFFGKGLQINGDDAENWTVIGLVARLKIKSKHNMAMNMQSHFVTPKSTPRCPTTVGSLAPWVPRAVQRAPLFERKWVDETWSFNHRALFASLRDSKVVLENVPGSYTWFPDAVPVDALLPPGVPMSAKEINAYYPHHFRWKQIALRLLNNGYEGGDIIEIQSWFRGKSQPPISSKQMAKWYRSIMRYELSHSSVKNLDRKPQRSLYTGNLMPPKSLRPRKFVIPTFDDLLAGLKYLPTGLDARGLTQCLTWYLNFRDMFTPRLSLNVLHVQSLIQALRQPLKTFGSRNLDMIALKEWREEHKYEQRTAKEEKQRYKSSNAGQGTALCKAQLRLNVDIDEVSLAFAIPVRSVLLFPCLAVLGLVGEALDSLELKSKQRAERQEDLEEHSEEISWDERQGDQSKKDSGGNYSKGLRKRPLEEGLGGMERSPKRVHTDSVADAGHPFGMYGQLGRYVLSRTRPLTPDSEDVMW